MGERKPLVSFLSRPDVQGTLARKDKPRAHEKRVARDMGGWTQPASGAIEAFKGDVSGVEGGDFEFLVECKRTVHGSLSVKGMWLDKIRREAEMVPGRSPALDIQIEKMQGENEWVMIPRSVFVRMLMDLRGD